MEHLLLPHDATIDQSDRVYCVADAYDGGPFLTFPQRSRFNNLYEEVTTFKDVYIVSQRFWDAAQIRELECFIQTWVIFGLLHEVFGTQATAAEFTEKSQDGNYYLTTACLPAMLDAWASSRARLKGTEKGEEWLKHLLDCIKQAYRLLQASKKRIVGSRGVLCSAAALAETIDTAIFALRDEPVAISCDWRGFYDSEEIGQAMQRNGWCPAEVAICRETYGALGTFYYFSKMRQPVIKDHSRCLDSTCGATQYDMASQSAAHRCAGRDCESLVVDDQALKAAFDQGSFGLLQFHNWQDANKLTFSVIPSGDNQPYVAISHVWADGLGNPFANDLPRCQLAYVAEIVSSLAQRCGHSSLPVWLDTLCCPITEIRYRNQCILRMRDIYSGASQVLVLDAQLSQLKCSEVSALKIGARLQCSSWSRRLWTMQEGFLATTSWLQLQDQSINTDVIVEGIYWRWDQNRLGYYQVEAALIASLNNLRGYGRTAAGRPERSIIDVHFALYHRAVTVASDEALCLCTYMNIDQRAVIEAKESDRMAVFWRELSRLRKSIPRCVLFWDGSRLNVPGLR